MPSYCPVCGDIILQDAGTCSHCQQNTVRSNSSEALQPVIAQASTSLNDFPLGKALFDFAATDDNQMSFKEGDMLIIKTQDADGWWTAEKDGKSGLVPGSYIELTSPSKAASPKQTATTKPLVRQLSAALLESNKVAESTKKNTSPEKIQKFKKCKVCNETIVGPMRTVNEDVFHEFCFVCKKCGDVIDEDEEFVFLKGRPYHSDCAEDVKFCGKCQEDMIGKGIVVQGVSYHLKCLTCSQCNEEVTKDDIKKGVPFYCSKCSAAIQEAEKAAALEAERVQKEALAAQEAKEKAEQAAALEAERIQKEALAAKEEREAAAAALEAEEKLRQEKKLAYEKEAEAAAKQQAEIEAAVAAAESKIEQETRAVASDLPKEPRSSVEENYTVIEGGQGILDQAPGDVRAIEKARAEEEVKKLEEEMKKIALENARKESRLESNSSIGSTYSSFNNKSGGIEQRGAGSKQVCAVCNTILDGPAVGAMGLYFHEECFRCAHCSQIISSDEGFNAKDNLPYHLGCYQTKFGPRCVACSKSISGKGVKALGEMYHPACFKCSICTAVLSDTFFDYKGKPVCDDCKQNPTRELPPPPATTTAAVPTTAISMATASYVYEAQDETQLSLMVGDSMSVLRKDGDGWWLVNLNGSEGFVPGSYLLEHSLPPTPPVAVVQAPTAAAPVKNADKQCSDCGAISPPEARFCPKCGNMLI